MNEAAFLAFENITAVMETILYGGSMAAFFSPFFGGTASKKSQRPFEKMLLIFIIYCAVYFAGIAVPIYNWQCMTAVILLLPAIHHILEMERKTAFFLAILFFSIRGLSRLTAESLYFIVNERFVVVKKELDAILYGTAVNYTATALLQFALFFFLLYLMGRRLRSAPLLLCGKAPIYLCLIPVVGILFTSLIYAMLFHVKDGVPFQVYEQYPLSCWCPAELPCSTPAPWPPSSPARRWRFCGKNAEPTLPQSCRSRPCRNRWPNPNRCIWESGSCGMTYEIT